MKAAQRNDSHQLASQNEASGARKNIEHELSTDVRQVQQKDASDGQQAPQSESLTELPE
jgi:hypothetical protein